MNQYVWHSLTLAIFAALPLTTLAHEGSGPEIDKDGNVIYHAELTHNISPVMPINAKESGYCCVMLDITKTGKVKHPEVMYCSSPVFRDITQRTAPKITYLPRQVNGEKMATTDHLQIFNFYLSNQWGAIIKNSDGYPNIDAEGAHKSEHNCRQYVT